jgi:hypothetical protein
MSLNAWVEAAITATVSERRGSTSRRRGREDAKACEQAEEPGTTQRRLTKHAARPRWGLAKTPPECVKPLTLVRNCLLFHT